MSNELLGVLLFFVIGFAWMIYLVQEIFISGVSLLNVSICNNEKERKQLQVISGLHFDGMEVWLIAALTLLFGVFPLGFASILQHLYVVFFVLVYALIGRGVSIEVIYKLDNPKWIKSMKITWLVSSIMIVFLLGVFMTSLFNGFPLGVDGLEGNFFSIINVTTISGGLLFTALSFVAGAGWISLTTEGEITNRGLVFVKKTGLIYAVPVLALMVVMGFNNTGTSLYAGELFTKSAVWFILPGLEVLAALMIIYYGFKMKGRQLFIHALAVMVLFVITGFVGTYPNVLLSSIDPIYSITIIDAMSGTNSLTIILWVTGVFFPIIIGYQTWKYFKFRDRVKLNDE
jgi:cytochrome d ubiquinol oxidase subunit II